MIVTRDNCTVVFQQCFNNPGSNGYTLIVENHYTNVLDGYNSFIDLFELKGNSVFFCTSGNCITN